MDLHCRHIVGASLPLTAKENVEDALAAPPLSSVPPPPSQQKVFGSGSSPLLGLDVSDQEAKNDEDVDEQVDILGLPFGDRKARDLVAAKGNLSSSKTQSSLGGSLTSSSSSGESRKGLLRWGMMTKRDPYVPG